MLGILLGILKCIGWILLGLILFIIALVCIVLFTPIKYRLQGKYTDTLNGEFRVSWLFGIFRVEGQYQDGAEPSFDIYIFGKSLSKGREKKARKKKKAPKGKEKPLGDQVVVARERPPRPKETPVAEEMKSGEIKSEEIKSEEIKSEEIKSEEIKSEEIKSEEIKSEEIKSEEIKSEEIKSEEIKPEEVKPIPAPLAEPQVLGQAKAEGTVPRQVRRVKLSTIEEKPLVEAVPLETVPIEGDKDFFLGEEMPREENEPSFWQKGKGYWEKFQEMPNKKEIFQAAKKLLKRLLKGIAPKDFLLKGTLGTGDPTYTGYLMGVVGILTAKFGNHVQVKGEFTRLVAEDIEVYVKGKIVIGSFLSAVLAFVLTKPVRQLLLKLWKGR